MSNCRLVWHMPGEGRPRMNYSGGYLPPLPFATSTPAGPCDSVAKCSTNKLPNCFKPAIAYPKESPTRAAFLVRARWGFLLYRR